MMTESRSEPAVVDQEIILCRECGNPCVVNHDGISNHILESDEEIDYDADADHVAIPDIDNP